MRRTQDPDVNVRQRTPSSRARPSTSAALRVLPHTIRNPSKHAHTLAAFAPLERVEIDAIYKEYYESILLFSLPTLELNAEK